MVDDHTRMAYSSTPRTAQPAPSRAARWFAPTVSHRPGDDRQRHGLAQARRDRRRSQTDQTLNGRQTLLGGWAYKQPYATNQQRRQALTRFLNTYNHRVALTVTVYLLGLAGAQLLYGPFHRSVWP